MWTLIWALSTVFGHDNLEVTDRLAPPGYQGNAWGPEATRLRASGEIPPIVLTSGMKQWQAWGKSVLKDGDVVFRRGDARILRGYFPMSRFLANASGSVFSHTGVVAIEGGEAVVYDTTSLSVRRQPFYVWVLDNVGPLGVKRVRPEYAAYAPKAVAYCRQMFLAQPLFDYELGIDDKALYCVEMTEKAYRSNGLPLAPPVRLGDMENIALFPTAVMGFLAFTPLTLDTPVYFPGNERHGIWSSPYLTTVYAPSYGATAKVRKGFMTFGGTGLPDPKLDAAEARPRTNPTRPDQKTAAGAGLTPAAR